MSFHTSLLAVNNLYLMDFNQCKLIKQLSINDKLLMVKLGKNLLEKHNIHNNKALKLCPRELNNDPKHLKFYVQKIVTEGIAAYRAQMPHSLF